MADLGRKLGEFSGRKLGEFVLHELIGDGGYGGVYRGEQPLLKRHVAVKVLHTRHQSDVALERFEREAQITSRLDSPYAAGVHAFGAEDDGLLWIAMELVQGITMSDWLTMRGPMSLDQFVHFFDRLAEVVQKAHKIGIVHRDLKPSNVMVIERDGRLFPKLLDFGIALVDYKVTFADASGPVAPPERDQNAIATSDPASGASADAHGTTHSSSSVLEYRLTPTGAMFGSAPYMSPEQWINTSAVGPAADIYSLGIMAYQALTGRLPFSARRNDEYHQQHREAKVPPLGDGCSPELDRIIQRALAKSPSDRHRDVVELASEFQAALRASDREQLRSSALQWKARDCAPGMLWGADLLSDLQGVTSRALAGEFTPLECSFVAASQRRARRRSWVRRSIGALTAALAMLGVCGFLLYRAGLLRRTANQIATQAEVEQGGQALLHGESGKAVRHLQQAYQRGDHSQGVKFMLARALQPRMSELARFTTSSGRMWSAAFAPDGKRVLTTDDKSAQMWDASSSQLLFTMSHGDTVYGAVFSLDGTRIVTGGGDGTVRIWSASTGAPVRTLTWSGAKQRRYSAIAMSSYFVAAIDSLGRAAHVWNAETGAQIADLSNGSAEVASLVFSSDGRWLATSGDDAVRVFDTSTWTQAVMVSGPRVRSLSFDPTGPRLAVGTYDGDASIWDIPSGARVRCLHEAGESIDAIAFSRDGKLIAAASRDGSEQVWDATSGGLRTHFNSHHGTIHSVEFSSSGNLMLSAGADGVVIVSNVATGLPIARLEGPTNIVLAAHFDPDSRRVVGAAWDGTTRVWDITAPYRRWGSPPIGVECDTAESLVPDQRFIALSCRNHGTRIWDTARDELVAELPAVTTVGGEYYSAFPALTATGDRAAIAHGNTVEVYALPSGQLIRTVLHPAAVNAVAFAPAGHDLVSGAVDGSLIVTRDGREPVALPTSHAGIDAAAILADGRVVSADASNRLRVFAPDHNARTLLMDLAVPSRVRLLRPSPDGTRLITISTRNEQSPPALWALDQYRLVSQLHGHVGRVFTARFVADGSELLTTGRDGTVRLWDAATGSPGRSFHGDSHFLADAVLAPDRSMVVAGGSDGFLRFWDAFNGRLLWMLRAHTSYVVGVHYEGDDIISRGFAGDVARWKLPQSDTIIEACQASACASAALEGR